MALRVPKEAPCCDYNLPRFLQPCITTAKVHWLGRRGRIFPARATFAVQDPTLASSSFVATLTILNCSAWNDGSGRKDSLPK